MNNLIIKKISKSFDGIQAVKDFSFEWQDQHILGLIGPNGAGKTTLFHILTEFLPADSGQFLFKGENLLKTPPHRIVHKGIARTFQDLRLLRVIENVLYTR